MARVSKAHTPRRQPAMSHKQNVEEQEEANEGANEPSSELGEVGRSDGKIRHLGSDLPDVPAGAQTSHPAALEEQQHGSGAPVADMGANNSREDTNAAIRATSSELRGKEGSEPAKRESRGKLRQISNPAYQNPVRNVGAQRRIAPPSTKGRGNPFDVPDDSPEKLPPRERRQTDQAAISPLRKQRGKPLAQQIPSSSARGAQGDRAKHEQQANEQPHPSPRRSGRRQQQQQDEDARGKQKTPAEAARENANSGAEEEDLVYKDRFRDDVVQRHAEAETNAGAEEKDGDDEATTLAKPGQSKQGLDPKRGPGRPKKSVESSNDAQVKKKPGRPRKTGNESEEAQQEQTKVTPKKRDQHGRFSKAAESSGGAVLEQPQRQTRAQKASESPQKLREKKKQSSTRAQTAINETRGRGVRPEQETEEQPGDRQADREPRHESDEDGLFVPGDEDSAGRPMEGLRAAKIRPSEVEFPDAQPQPGTEAAVEEDTGDERPTQSRKRKRQASKRPVKPNTGAKRSRRTARNDDSDDETFDAGPQANKQRLWGQWPVLRQAFDSCKYVGCNVEDGDIQPQNEIDLEDEQVAAVVKLCREAKKRFTHLRDNAGSVEQDHDPNSVLVEIGTRVDGLRGFNKDFPTDFKDQTKCTNIYFHLIPRLVKLVVHMATCYEAMDKDEVPGGQITIDHLRVLNEAIILILDLETSAAKRYTARPDTSHHVVLPVHNDIAVPLRGVRDKFKRVIQAHENAILEAARREDEARDCALRLEQEERRSRQLAHLRLVREKWERLHGVRLDVEMYKNIIHHPKHEHLKTPNPDRDVDANGTPYERVEVFHSRVGPPPGLVDRAAATEWTMKELTALCEGLREYAGPKVYEKIFLRYCPKGQVLNEYNVTEIVTTAAGLKIMLAETEKEDDGCVKAWVSSIPVWTKGPLALGKENDEGGVVSLTQDDEMEM